MLSPTSAQPLSSPCLPPDSHLPSCHLPYPAEMRIVREVVVGGTIAIARAQNPHKQLRVLHFSKAHFQLSIDVVERHHISENKSKPRSPRVLAHPRQGGKLSVNTQGHPSGPPFRSLLFGPQPNHLCSTFHTLILLVDLYLFFVLSSSVTPQRRSMA